MLNRSMLAATLALMMSTQAPAQPPEQRTLFLRCAGGLACVSGWAFFFTRHTPRGSQALAAYLTANTALYLFNNFPRNPKN